jgi:hypothetical protein
VRWVRGALRGPDEQDKELLRRLPAPHPSIVYGLKENDDDGLVYWVPDREPHTINRFINPSSIEVRIDCLSVLHTCSLDKYGRKECSEQARPTPLSSDELALKSRFEARLEISLAYEAEIDRLEQELGIDELRKQAQEWTDKWASLECEILREPARSKGDLTAKLSIYDRTGHDVDAADDILCDFRRMLRNQPQFDLARILRRRGVARCPALRHASKVQSFRGAFARLAEAVVLAHSLPTGARPLEMENIEARETAEHAMRRLLELRASPSPSIADVAAVAGEVRVPPGSSSTPANNARVGAWLAIRKVVRTLEGNNPGNSELAAFWRRAIDLTSLWLQAIDLQD